MERAARALVAVSLATAALTCLAGAASAAAQPTTWNFQQAGVPAAQPLGDYGKGVLVAVVDTWVDPNQPQFGGRVVDEADCLPGTCQDHTYAPDSCVHGTHVAGTIASAGYGVAPEADILAVQVLSGTPGSPDPNSSCSGSVSTVAAGIDFAVAKGARVINLSVGEEIPGVFQSSQITQAVANAANHGVVVVFAAGNSSIPLTDSYGNDALLVAATGPGGQLASYSDYNSAVTGDVNVAAPGGDSGNDSCAVSDCVLSTFPDNQLGLLEGTSMAAPHVSGLAALLLAQNPSRGVANVYSTIEDTATPLAGAGSGLIDAAKALQVEAASHPAPRTTTATPRSVAVVAPAGRPFSPPTNGGTVPVTEAPPGGGAVRPAQTGSATVPTATTLPSTTTSLSAGAGSPPTAASSGAEASPKDNSGAIPAKASGWAARHAAVLVVACLLLGAVLLGMAWWRRRRLRA